MSERTREDVIAVAVETAKSESDNRRFLQKFRQSFLTQRGIHASPDEEPQGPDSSARLEHLRKRVERSAATGVALSGDPRLTSGHEHCVGLGDLIHPTNPGFDRSLVGVVISSGGVLTVNHGSDPARVAFGADLKRVVRADTVGVSSCASHSQADARLALLTNGALVTECPMATTAEFEAARTGILVGFDGNDERMEQELDIASCHRGRMAAEWEFIAVALTSTMRQIGPSDSGSVFYIRVADGSLRAAGLLIREVGNAGCGPEILFTRVDFVSQWALALVNPFDRQSNL